jgi:nitrilase
MTRLAEPFVAAVVQAAPVVFDLERSLARVVDLATDAARRGAKIILFPEAFLSGYPHDLDFGTRFGFRTPDGREQFARYFESAVDVPGPAVSALGATARSVGAYLVVGVIERAGGTLYCSALFFAPNGAFLGKHRKLMPTALERVTWGFGDGSSMPVYETPFGRIGAVICWENYMPLMRAAMFAKGIQLYCAPTADDLDTWVASMRHIACEGRCFVLAACQYLRRSDCPTDYPDGGRNSQDTVLMRGGSCIVGPLGQVLAGPAYGEEVILTAELDPRDLVKSKFDFDVVGHYARPDIFQLHVNERPAQSVVLSPRDITQA